MSYFSTALKEVLDSTFQSKQKAFGEATGIDQAEISRLLREVTPCSAAKLDKLCQSKTLTENDRVTLIMAAIRDYVPENMWKKLFAQGANPAATSEQVSDDTQWKTVEYYGHIPPRSLQIIRYLVERAQHDADVISALDLIGKFLKLPEPK
jgi:hypothetical protein